MWSEFPWPKLDQWLSLVAKEAKGKTPGQLNSHSWEGLIYPSCCDASVASLASCSDLNNLSICEVEPDQRPSQIKLKPVLRGPLGMPALLALAEYFPQIEAIEFDLSQFFQHGQSLGEGPADLEVRFTSQTWVQQGADTIHELAWSFAGLIEVLRTSATLPQSRLSLKLSASPRLLLEVAKWRAARRLWDTICHAYGLNWPARIHLVQDRRWFTLQDPHNNLLRSTLSAIAGLLGGAASIELLPCDSSADAWRWAENIQHLLYHEAHLHTQSDPLAGSGLIEELTQEIAQAAWKEVQRIEASGGLRQQKDLWMRAREQQLHFEDLLRRDQQGLIGVNRYVHQADFTHQPPRLSYAPQTPVSLEEARTLIKSDSPLYQTGLLPPLDNLRWSEAFEEVMRRGRGKSLDVLVLGQAGPVLRGYQNDISNWLSMAGIEPRFHHHQTPAEFQAPSLWMLCCEDEGPNYKTSLNPPVLLGKPPHAYQGIAFHPNCNRVYCLEQLLDRMP